MVSHTSVVLGGIVFGLVSNIMVRSRVGGPKKQVADGENEGPETIDRMADQKTPFGMHADFDFNQDGFISGDELNFLGGALGIKDEPLTALVKSIDTDRD